MALNYTSTLIETGVNKWLWILIVNWEGWEQIRTKMNLMKVYRKLKCQTSCLVWKLFILHFNKFRKNKQNENNDEILSFACLPGDCVYKLNFSLCLFVSRTFFLNNKPTFLYIPIWLKKFVSKNYFITRTVPAILTEGSDRRVAAALVQAE